MNSIIISEFNKLIKQVEGDIDISESKNDETRNLFRLRQLRKIIKILATYPKKITSGDQVASLPGIGEKTVMRIDEILKYGKLSEIIDTPDSSDLSDAIEELTKINGIGRKFAKKLITTLNIKTIDELQYAYKSGELSLNNNVIMGLKYHNVYQRKIPRSEVLEIDIILHKKLYKISPELHGLICGSYRRQSPFSNDVDFLFVHPNVIRRSDLSKHTNYLNKFVTLLINDGLIVDSLTGLDVETKYMGYFKSPSGIIRRIDIRYMPYDSYYAAILYFTGSADFNKQMRNIAISLGYKLNEYGLFTESGRQLSIKSEEHIFKLLGMEFVAPQNRT